MSLWKVITKTPVVKQEIRRGSFVWGRDGFTWVGAKEPAVTSSVSPSSDLSPTSSTDGDEETETNRMTPSQNIKHENLKSARA